MHIWLRMCPFLQNRSHFLEPNNFLLVYCVSIGQLTMNVKFVITRAIIYFIKKNSSCTRIFFYLSSTTLFLSSIGFQFNEGVGSRFNFKSYKMVYGEGSFKYRTLRFLNVVLYFSCIVFHVIFWTALLYHIQQVLWNIIFFKL